ncbi:MAG TPA: class I adenylate-forming enzyme family protein [Fluviicola sp.]|nr:class I adenylate-forming enzyme family protein [Fluviicola sp.]
MNATQRIIDHLERQSKTIPDKVFITDANQVLTYGELFQRVLETASGLQERGVQTGDRLMLLLEHGIDHLITYFAAGYIGAIPVHLSINRPKGSVQQIAAITTSAYCVTDNYPEPLNDCDFREFPFHGLAGNGSPVRGSHEVAYMMFTSGTTGAPKAVMTTHKNTIATAESILDFTKMTTDDRELISLPLAFTFGLGHIHALIIVGGQAVLTNRRYDLEHLTTLIQQKSTTGFLASPAMLRDMVNLHREALICCGHYLRYVVVNCTPMEASLTQELLDLLPGTQIIMYYGSTEASRCAYIHYNENRHRLDFTGKRTINVELKIDNPDENGLGEICMKGPNVMLGYWNNPEETAKAIDADGWYRSGDWGIMDEDGYIKVIGRINDQISVDGMKCQPSEVENVIGELPWVERVTVCGITDEAKFQVVGAAIITAGNAVPQDVHTAIREHCAGRLEPFKIPVVVSLVDQFPANELGKVNRKELAAQLKTQFQEA